MKRVVFLLFVIFSTSYAYDKRLQNANLDFINFEGHNRKPTPQPNLMDPNNEPPKQNPNTGTSTTRLPGPNQQRPNVVTGTSSTTKAPVQNPPKGATGTTANAGGPTNVRQLVQNYNNLGTTETPRPSLSNNRNSPQTNNQGNLQGNSGSSWASVAAGRNPTGTVKPLVIPTSPGASRPGSPSAVNPQGLPGQPGVAKPATPGASWASVASGNSKPQVAPGSPSAVNPQGFPGQPGSPRPGSPSAVNPQGFPGQPGSSRPGSPSAVNPQGFPGQPGAPRPGSPSAVNPQGFPGQPSAPKPGTPGASWASVAGGKSPQVPGSPGGAKPQSTPGSPNPTPTQAKTTSIPGGPKTTAAPEIASDKELLEISEALLSKDVNNPSKYVTVNIQKKTTSFSKDDLADEPLFTIDKEVWKIPTIAAMKVLLDNYEQDTTVNEHVTPQEKNEENAFLDAVMATSVMRHLMTFLRDKGIVTPDPKQQRDVLKQTWFNMYSRGQGKIGSSGFEHIFLSEIKNNEVSGLHNWLYFHTEEEAKRANYLGYLKKVDLGTKGNVLKLHFSLKGIDKPVDTMFVGTSPELEMALYSLCFYTRADKSCPISLGGQQINLRTHNYRYRSKNMIGSAFPEI